MDRTKPTAVLVGVLYIIGTVAGVGSVVVTQPLLRSPAYLTTISAQPNHLVVGTLLVLLMGCALAMVPVLLFPVLKHHHEVLALSALVFRGVLETVCYLAAVLVWLALLALSREYVHAGLADAALFQSLGTVLLQTEERIAQLLAIVFSLGALAIYAVFYQAHLVPRWLALWGLGSAMLYLAAPLLALFGFEVNLLMAPLAVQEMVLALWLIVKGFNPSAREPANQAQWMTAR